MMFAVMEKENEIQISRSSQLYKGIFWIVNLDDYSLNSNYCFLIPTNLNGDNIENVEVNAKSGTTFNHERTWNSLPRKLTQGEKYNYFPRGRVEISHGKAVIYANPHICNDELKKFIIDEFNLNKHNGISEIIIKADGSEHYKCFLDS